jgi:3-oxoacyl-(acyl-carrier-protein) synthase
MAFYRQDCMGRLTHFSDQPGAALRPFDAAAAGTVLGEGGGIITLEAWETATKRGARIYAELVGFGASHTIHPDGRGLVPDPAGKGIASAIRAALRDAKLTPADVDAIIATGSAIPAWDAAEVAAMRNVFGDRLASVPVWTAKAFVGNCGAGAGGIDVAIAAKMLLEQKIPARINCDKPIGPIQANSSAAAGASLRSVLVFSTSLGGQNAALILQKAGDA